MVRVLCWLIGFGWFMPVLASTAAPDPHSFANYQQVRTRHLLLDLAVDFTRQQLTGFAEHQLERLDPTVNRLVLDSRHLKITTVTFTNDGVHWQPAAYLLGIEDALKGQPLTIQLQALTKAVRVYYQTTPQASGLQWLTAAQTSEKKQPFLFSQSQAIHARSWIPLQDTPANRITYQAHIKTPPELLAVMSADNSANTNRNGDYHFDMPQPLPSYLIALAVGDLHFKAMSADTGVYAEKLWLDRAIAEFSDTQKMMDAANQLFGKYPWKRYDLLVLPSSFPFGGMENPRLSFVTPTIITGDKSLISLVAHELAHSWSGNLVTNASWNDVWLNEGFTNYVENRIMQKVYGQPRADMELLLNVRALRNLLTHQTPADSRLQADYSGRDPDEAFQQIPYVKGQLLLLTLAQHFGQARFDQFLHDYFAHFAFQSIQTEAFVGYFQQQLNSKQSFSEQALRRWLNAPGLPDELALPASDAFARVNAAQQQWLAGKAGLRLLPTVQWSVHEWLHFIDLLPRDLTVQQLNELDLVFSLSQTGNAEVFTAWAKLVIPLNYQPIIQPLRQFLLSVGRQKFIVPLYSELKANPQWRSWARQVYREARPGYHPLAQQQLDKLAL
ncbi:MAG: M1 family metallopeptidase [Rheinheimera sp.]|nr:M1 family metallopeptidase [Rheinheimera sp.]